MKFVKVFILTLLVFLNNDCVAQCNDFNINFNYSDGFYQLSDPIKCKNGDYIISSWYLDKSGINTEIIKDFTRPIPEKNTLFRFNSKGVIIQQISIQNRFPFLNFGITLDSLENIYIPVTNVPNEEFMINDTLKLNSNNFSTYGIIKISKDFKMIKYTEIGRTRAAKSITNPHNLGLAISNDKMYLLLEANEDVLLADGSDLIHDNAFNSLNYLITLDLNGNISNRSLLSKSTKGTWSIGWEHINNKHFAIIQYTDTINFPSIQKTQIAAIRTNYNLPPKNYPGNDIAILEIANGELIKTYNIGCPGTFRFSGVNKKIHYKNNRYLFSFLNGSNGIFDNQNNSSEGKNSNRNVVVVMDTNFNLVKYIPLETTASNSINSISYLNLFRNSDDNTMLYTVSNNWFVFQNDTVNIEDRTDPNSFNVSLYKFQGDSFKKEAQLNSPDFRFRAHEYTREGLLAYLQKTDSGHDNYIWGKDLKSGYYKNTTWFGRFCGDVLDISDISPSAIDIQIFPNPISDKFQITFPQNNIESTRMNIYDIHGRLIHSELLKRKMVDGYTIDRPKSLYTNSMYFITITTDTGKCYKKTITTH